MISRLRRKLLKSSAMVLVLPVCTFVSNAHSSRDNPFWPLIDVLRSIGKPVCAEVAGSLSDKNAADKNYSLHLRNAGLNSEDAGQIGQSMRGMTSGSTPSVRVTMKALAKRGWRICSPICLIMLGNLVWSAAIWMMPVPV
jgi:hypothetical protein